MEEDNFNEDFQDEADFRSEQDYDDFETESSPKAKRSFSLISVLTVLLLVGSVAIICLLVFIVVTPNNPISNLLGLEVQATPTLLSAAVAPPTFTATPIPTETPDFDLPPTHTPAPTDTPAPTSTPAPTYTPTAIPPLAMDWVSTEIRCISPSQWAIKFWLTASGGTGEYTFYHDIQRLHGPHPADGFGYELTVGTGAAAVGTFAVESGTQRVQSEFWIARPDCGH